MPQGKRPAHQNAFAFRHNPKSLKTAKILQIPNVGVCRRCHAIIEWRKKYRKYRPLEHARRCNGCGERRVKLAYHTLCSTCGASGSGRCCKCGGPLRDAAGDAGEAIDGSAEDRELAEELERLRAGREGLSERERRSRIRELERWFAGADDEDGEDGEEEEGAEEGEGAAAGGGAEPEGSRERPADEGPEEKGEKGEEGEE